MLMLKEKLAQCNTLSLIFLFLSLSIISSCERNDIFDFLKRSAKYSLIYDANGGSGSAPETSLYPEGAAVTVAAGFGNISMTGYAFLVWNTSTDGTGTYYAEGAELIMPAEDLTLYAQWITDTTSPGSVTLDRNITKGAESIVLAWTDPADSDLDHINVDWGTSGTNVSAGTQSCTISGLTVSTEYAITLISVDAAGNESTAVSLSLTTAVSGDSDFTGYLVSDRTGLEAMANDLAASYILIADIDLSGTDWTPVGTVSIAFTGSLDGAGNTISNLTISSASSVQQGLFKRTNGSVLQYLELKDVNIDITSSGSFSYTGALTGYCMNSIIRHCSLSGSVSAYYHTGGLTGYSSGVEISNCHSEITVTGLDDYTGGFVGRSTGSSFTDCSYIGSITGIENTGGLVGYIGSGTVTNCYAAGTVDGAGYVGGLCGYTYQSTIDRCYATCDVSDSEDTSGTGSCTGYGGLIGYSEGTISSDCHASGSVTVFNGNTYADGFAGYADTTISSSYSTGHIQSNGTYIGGFAGYAGVSPTDCFYDRTSSGFDAAGGTGCGWTEEGTAASSTGMQTAAFYTVTGTGLTTAWDFLNDPNDDTGTGDYWNIDSSINSGYPYLTGLAVSY